MGACNVGFINVKIKVQSEKIGKEEKQCQMSTYSEPEPCYNFYIQLPLSIPPNVGRTQHVNTINA